MAVETSSTKVKEKIFYISRIPVMQSFLCRMKNNILNVRVSEWCTELIHYVRASSLQILKVVSYIQNLSLSLKYNSIKIQCVCLGSCFMLPSLTTVVKKEEPTQQKKNMMQSLICSLGNDQLSLGLKRYCFPSYHIQFDQSTQSQFFQKSFEIGCFILNLL